MSPYHQGSDRPVIQHRRHEKGDWIVWDWERAAWDVVSHEFIENEPTRTE